MPSYRDSRVLEYHGIFFSCIHDETLRETVSLKDHALIHLIGGILEIAGPGRTIRLSPGECIFVRKDCNITLAKSCGPAGEPFKAVAMIFERSFLLGYYRRSRPEIGPVSAVRPENPLRKIPARPDVSGLFQSLLPYFWSEEKPDREWADMKKTEGLRCLLKTDANLYASLFDFTSRWKIDLREFMEENYMMELSLPDFAHFSGRSLSAFNRDFRRIFGEPPQKWLIRRRLELARELLAKGDVRVQDAMADAGFCNFSHFSRVYKARFGYPPSEEKKHDAR
ncbi:MAG: helix-turn-helix transcriptional regulator [Bacteroidales bacterium]|nr:helix-turn-helix transcriptional regulator [Bacteroidales bacterium]